MALELINPDDLPVPEMYTQVVVATGSRLVFISGQQPEDIHGKLVGQQGMVTERITGLEAGRIKLAGEIWSAKPYDDTLSIEPGSTVEVLEIRGATAYVHPVPSLES